MNAKQTKIAREQLDIAMQKFASADSFSVPRKGWIRAIRDSLGMTGRQLAARLGVNQQRVARIEKDENLGKVTLATMREVAEAMDCTFVYGFVAKGSLDQIVKQQAAKVADKRMARSNQLMRLEKQELNGKEKQRAAEMLAEDIVEKMPRSLWD